MNLEPIRALVALELRSKDPKAEYVAGWELRRAMNDSLPALSQLLEAVTNLEKLEAKGWVSIEDVLPNDGQYVIFYFEDPDMDCTIMTGWYEVDSFWGDAGPSRFDSVTHWMPLPSPPEDK